MFYPLWINRRAESNPRVALQCGVDICEKIPEQAAAGQSFHTVAVSCVVTWLFRGESCGHVFLKFYGCTVQHSNYSVIEPLRTLDYVFAGV